MYKPRPLTNPTFVGDLVAGQLLTVIPGSWAASGPVTFRYLWIVGGVSLPQITVPEFELPQSAAGAFVRCIVTASDVGGRTSFELVSALPVLPVKGVWLFEPSTAGVTILTYPALPPFSEWVLEPSADGARIIRYPGDA